MREYINIIKNLFEGEVVPFTPSSKPVDALTRLRGSTIYDLDSKMKARTALNNIDEFTKAYIEAIAFTEFHADNEELEEATIEDFSPQLIHEIINDCKAFEDKVGYEVIRDYGVERAGHDFWLTRNRHGAGFWECDHCDEETGKFLTDVSHSFGEVDIYCGDDGLIY